MTYRKFKSKEEKKPRDPHDFFINFPIRIPAGLMQRLDEKSKELKIPKARLICYSIFNELELEKPFYFNIDLPDVADVPYVEDKYLKESLKLYDHIVKSPVAPSLDVLVLCKDDLGMSRETILLAYRELLFKGIVEEYYLRTATFDYHPDHMRIRSTMITPERAKERRKYEPIKVKDEQYKSEDKRGPLDDVT